MSETQQPQTQAQPELDAAETRNDNIAEAYHQMKDINKLKVIRRAIESTSEFNLILNRQRIAERSVYVDQQTETTNYPVGLGRHNKTLTSTNKIGRYPVAVMPSQYQDWYIEYSPEELKFLPVDTVLHGPVMSLDKLPPVLTTPDVSDFSDTDSSYSCDTCCSDVDNDGDVPMNEDASGSESSTCSSCVKPKRIRYWPTKTPSPPHLTPIHDETIHHVPSNQYP